jgi:hypothetical protein
MSGNAGTDPATQFIGTTDSVDVVFRSNNAEQIRLGRNSTKISSGNLLIGDSLGVFSKTDSNGKKVLQFGNGGYGLSAVNPGETLFVHYCAQPLSMVNLFDGFIYARAGWNAGSQPQLSMGADGNNALIEATDGVPITANYEPRLLINTYCGNDVLVGNTQEGRLIANYKLGVKTSEPQADFHVEGASVLNGAVSIGTTNCAHPDYMLAVNGKIIASEVKVQIPTNGCWPDYVLRPDYQLMPTEELERFIKIFNHLPDMPNANQIEAEGINSSEMHMLEVKKIEELSLYIIEVNKELTKLRAEIEELKRKQK